MPSRTVLFDLDGTLTDSAPGIVASYRHALRAFGLDADGSAIRRWIGPPLEDGFVGLGVPPGQVTEAVSIYRSFFATTGMYENRLFDGVPDLLSELRTAGVTLGLATSKLHTFAEAIVDHFGIAEHFAVVAGASIGGQRTEKEQIVDFALESLGRPDPSTVTLVGDREHDVRAALYHGIHAVGVAWGYGSIEELTASGCEVIASDPAAVARLILQRGEEPSTPLI